MDDQPSETLWPVFMPQKPIRVLQVGMSDNYGGTEATIYGIYNHLDHLKIQFDFLNVYGHPIAKQKELEAQGAHVYDLLLKRREGFRKYVNGIKAFYQQHAAEFDAVQCNVQCLDQIDMAKYAKRFGIKKTIVYAHNAGYGIQPSRLARVAIWWNKKRCHKYVDQFVGCSGLANQFVYSGRDAKRAVVINTGIATEQFAYSLTKREAFRKRFGFTNSMVVYGSAGRFDPQKNQLFLLQVFKEVSLRNPKARFFISGRGPLEKTLQARIKDLGMDDCCILTTDFLDYQEFYSGIDAFVLPSLFEGLGVVLIEAQCSGLACFASAKVIPQEARLLPSFCSIPLSESPNEWAARLSQASLFYQNRADALLLVQREKRDLKDSAGAYQHLLESLL
jgi:glycosyltransferase involved in cell wall biosynthesis